MFWLWNKKEYIGLKEAATSVQDAKKKKNEDLMKLKDCVVIMGNHICSDIVYDRSSGPDAEDNSVPNSSGWSWILESPQNWLH